MNGNRETALAGDVVIAGAARSPFRRVAGDLATVDPAELAGQVLSAAAEQAGLAADVVEEVLLGRALAAGEGGNPARRAAVAAGCGSAVAATTLSCGTASALVALVDAVRAIRSGDRSVVLAGGADVASQMPYLIPQARQGSRLGAVPLVDGSQRDLLYSPYMELPLSALAALVSRAEGLGAKEMDEFLRGSKTAAGKAVAARLITVTVVRSGRDDLVIDKDEAAAMSAVSGSATPLPEDLPPAVAQVIAAFASGAVAHGGATPGVAGLADGAGALAVLSAARAAELGCTGLVRVVATASAGVDPDHAPLALTPAVEQVLANAGWKAEDVDVMSLDDTVAVGCLHLVRQLGVPVDRINPDGGALALGHAGAGTSGRMLVESVGALAADAGRRAVVAALAGGGLAWAVALERI